MQRDTKQTRIILDLPESVHRDGERSQRNCASEVGVALRLNNPFLKFCIRKGYLMYRDFTSVTEAFSGAVIGDLQDPGTAFELARAALGHGRVMVPQFLRASLPKWEAA